MGRPRYFTPKVIDVRTIVRPFAPIYQDKAGRGGMFVGIGVYIGDLRRIE